MPKKAAASAVAAAKDEVITLTFGDCAENHVGNQQIGQRLARGQGFTRADLERIQHTIHSAQDACSTDLVTLTTDESTQEDACVLVIRNGVNALLRDVNGQATMLAEQQALTWDSKCKMYGRVVNKHARHNLCYDEKAQEPNYEQGEGRIIALDTVPHLQQLMHAIRELVGEKADGLKVEGNRYYDAATCGIGWHSDLERVKVIGVRLGTVGIPIHFHWFLKGEPVGERITIPLQPGDIYLMSEKAVAPDGRKKNIPILRHSVGAEKYTRLPSNV